MLLWAGQSASEIGTAITGLVLPLLAITVLHADTGQVGILQACSTAAYLLASIPAGILVDRSRKRIVMLVCDVGRCLLLATIPLSAAFGQLWLPQLYLVAFLTGVFSVIFGIAYHSYYPGFVEPAALPDANAKIGATEAFARVSGPGLGALLVGAVGAALAVVVDVITYVISTISLLFLKVPGDNTAPTGKRLDVRAETREGFSLVWTDRILARTAACTVASVFCLSMTSAVFVYYLIRDLRVSTGTVGISFVLGEAGGLVAAVVASRLMRRIGTARVLWLVVFTGPAGYLVVLADHASALLLASAFMMLSSARFVLFDIAQYTYRQLACPLDKLGKVNATIRLGVGTASAAGALVGGWLGVVIGSRATIAVATTLLCLAGLLVVFSPLRRVRDVSELVRASGQPEKVAEPAR